MSKRSLPPTTAIPIAIRHVPLHAAYTSGTNPKIVEILGHQDPDANAVWMPEADRFCHAQSASWRWLALNSTIRIPFFATRPISIRSDTDLTEYIHGHA